VLGKYRNECIFKFEMEGSSRRAKYLDTAKKCNISIKKSWQQAAHQ